MTFDRFGAARNMDEFNEMTEVAIINEDKQPDACYPIEDVYTYEFTDIRRDHKAFLTDDSFLCRLKQWLDFKKQYLSSNHTWSRH